MVQEKINGMEPKLTNDEKFLLAVSQGNEEKLTELKKSGYNPSMVIMDRLHVNLNSDEARDKVSKVFGIDIEKKDINKTAELHKESVRSAEETMNI